MQQKTDSIGMLENCNKTVILTYEPQVRDYESRLRAKGFKKYQLVKILCLKID